MIDLTAASRVLTQVKKKEKVLKILIIYFIIIQICLTNMSQNTVIATAELDYIELFRVFAPKIPVSIIFLKNNLH